MLTIDDMAYLYSQHLVVLFPYAVVWLYTCFYANTINKYKERQWEKIDKGTNIITSFIVCVTIQVNIDNSYRWHGSFILLSVGYKYYSGCSYWD